MKKFLLLGSVAASFGVTAQSYTAADTLQPGMSETYYVMDSNAVNLDAITGSGVTWNYSTLYGEIGVATNSDVVQLASAGTNAADFPEAEYNDDLASFASVYFSNSADSVTVYGFVFTVDGFDVVLHHDANPLKAMTFPAAVGTTISDVTAGIVDVNGGFATGLTTGTANVDVDGFGTLIVGGDTITNVLRVKLVENISTEITIFPFPTDYGTVTRTIYSYYHLSSGKQAIFQHATIDINTTLVNDSFNAVFYHSLPSYVGVAEQNVNHFSVYPNPASDFVTVTTSGNASQMSMYTVNGQLVTSFINPQVVETIEVSELPAGTYIIQVIENGTAVEEKIIVE
ncbi:MAG: T9SS type A sorting domain-containing protein [Crocinitomicaceae bacterium]|nr:T9SS type A sorting domain-containing protein [Crocinitomicaceae bacterium]MBK8926008.1 T9SS type A sorting domain-containing protein [Crocinitomicaceae bacterium]